MTVNIGKNINKESVKFMSVNGKMVEVTDFKTKQIKGELNIKNDNA